MNQAMVLVDHFSKLILLRRKPQDLPYSMGLLCFLLCLTFCLLLFSNPSFEAPFFKVLLFASKNGIFLALLYHFLKRHALQNRFIQTACNYVGVSAISQIFLSGFESTGFEPNGPLFFLFWALMAWFLVLKIHITQHAFNMNRWQAFGILFAMALITNLIVLTFVLGISHLFSGVTIPLG